MQTNETKRGPGRPRVFPEGKMINRHVQLTSEQIAAAERLGGGTFVEGVRMALEPYVMNVEIWQHRTEGTQYAVLIDGGICVSASGPLHHREVEEIQAGATITYWNGMLGAKIAVEVETTDCYRRVWPAKGT